MHPFDFDDAITKHRTWKMKFHLALDRIRSSDYDTRPLGDDTRCALGEWLAANAGELQAFQSAKELGGLHQEFHQQSEAIAKSISSGSIVHLGDKAIVEFGDLSEKIEALLERLKNDVRQAG